MSYVHYEWSVETKYVRTDPGKSIGAAPCKEQQLHQTMVGLCSISCLKTYNLSNNMISIAHIFHDRHDLRWCTFLLQREPKISTFFGLFWLFGWEFTHFLVYFYRPKKCVGLPKLTNVRYDDDHLQGAIPEACLEVHQTQQSLRGENNLASLSCLKTAIYSALKCKLASLKNPKNNNI